ncbi:Predicted metal-dependent enzyme [Listeria fleischmannii subsp. fleischmannii]|uniref:Predicted metal-dependent enzyme n=1 Tax=Listeria fleischmannii subsp. fleischmannii TaxID=1671902 RepID=A0A2X3GMB1_9LIST|nr:Predicted metal-dependent enzyme [Listeria fleischmannii subsp. fleischmannii]
MLKETQKPAYGGQAVVEGVMFGGKKQTVTAIRRLDGTFEFFYLEKNSPKWVKNLKRVPFIRGIVALVESSAIGSKHLTFATDRYDEDPNQPESEEKIEKKESKVAMWLGVAVIGVLSFIFAKFVMTLIPVFLAQLFRFLVPGDVGQVILESFFKLLLLLTYIFAISQTPIIKRVFQYHGSEHKVINCYENNLPLTVSNVQKQSRLHYRCGSSFILFTVIVGMFIYFLVPTDPLWLRVVDRILLIPVVLGVAFEVLQLTNKCRNIPVLRFLGYPGLWLQLITTKEPEDDQVEVAIASFNELLRIEKEGVQEVDLPQI